MGLDMYLSAKLYMSEYGIDAHKKAFKKLHNIKLPGVTVPKPYMSNFDSVQLEVPIAYWRKAHQLHDWFVAHVQDGKDECQTAYVDVDHLRELDKLCAQVVLAGTPTYAAQYLPDPDGDYDEWYFEQVRNTMDALHRLLADVDAGLLDSWEFYYHASW